LSSCGTISFNAVFVQVRHPPTPVMFCCFGKEVLPPFQRDRLGSAANLKAFG